MEKNPDDIPIEDLLVGLIEENMNDQEHKISIPDVEEIHIPNKIENELYPLGISNIFIMFFDEAFGPRLYSYAKKDEMIEKILENPAFGAEVTILAKYANEILLKNGKRLIIRDININQKQYYLFVQVNKGFISPKPLKIAKIIADMLEKNGKIDERIIVNSLEIALRSLGRYL